MEKLFQKVIDFHMRSSLVVIPTSNNFLMTVTVGQALGLGTEQVLPCLHGAFRLMEKDIDQVIV